MKKPKSPKVRRVWAFDPTTRVKPVHKRERRKQQRDFKRLKEEIE